MPKKAKNRDPYVFVSYAREDFLLADELVAALDRAEVRVRWWLDRESIGPGENYPSALDYGLDGSSLVVLLFSKNSAFKPGVLDEFRKARTLGKPVVKILIDDLEQVVRVDSAERAVKMKDSEVFAGVEATEQLIVGGAGAILPPEEWDRIARKVGDALVSAFDVATKLDALGPTSRTKDDPNTPRALADIGYITIRPIMDRMLQVSAEGAEKRRQDHEAGKRESWVAFDHLSRLALTLEATIRRTMKIRASMGQGAGIHPEDLRPDDVVRVIKRLLEDSKVPGGDAIFLQAYFDVLIALGRTWADEVVGAVYSEQANSPNGIDYFLLVYLGALGNPEAVSVVLDSFATESWESLRRAQVFKTFVRHGDVGTAAGIRSWLENPKGRAKNQDEAREALEGLEGRLAMGGRPILEQIAVYSRPREDQITASYAGIQPTRADVELALILFETGHLPLDSYIWGRTPPQSLADIKRRQAHYVKWRGMDGVDYELGPKDVWRLTYVLLTGEAINFNFYGGDPVNKPLQALGFEGSWSESE